MKISTNPLRDPQDRRLPRIPEPCALVIFGVTGDLARKKLIPAVYDLANRGLLPPGFVVLGFARRDWGDGDFETIAKAAAQKHARTPWSEDVWSRVHGIVSLELTGVFAHQSLEAQRLIDAEIDSAVRSLEPDDS